MLKLYTFNISHFAEKARWTLDYEGIAYEERVLVPGPHQLVTRRIARRTHVPVLEHDGQYVQGSSARAPSNVPFHSQSGGRIGTTRPVASLA